MMTSKEFFERLESDESFAQKVSDEIIAKREAGAKDYYETFLPVAAENGYSLSREELDAVVEARSAELSDEELGKVAGGTSCLSVAIVASIVTSLASLTYSLHEASIDTKDHPRRVH